VVLALVERGYAIGLSKEGVRLSASLEDEQRLPTSPFFASVPTDVEQAAGLARVPRIAHPDTARRGLDTLLFVVFGTPFVVGSAAFVMGATMWEPRGAALPIAGGVAGLLAWPVMRLLIGFLVRGRSTSDKSYKTLSSVSLVSLVVFGTGGAMFANGVWGGPMRELRGRIVKVVGYGQGDDSNDQAEVEVSWEDGYDSTVSLHDPQHKLRVGYPVWTHVGDGAFGVVWHRNSDAVCSDDYVLPPGSFPTTSKLGK
jgi:hypothetical protein